MRRVEAPKWFYSEDLRWDKGQIADVFGQPMRRYSQNPLEDLFPPSFECVSLGHPPLPNHIFIQTLMENLGKRGDLMYHGNRAWQAAGLAFFADNDIRGDQNWANNDKEVTIVADINRDEFETIIEKAVGLTKLRDVQVFPARYREKPERWQVEWRHSNWVSPYAAINTRPVSWDNWNSDPRRKTYRPFEVHLARDMTELKRTYLPFYACFGNPAVILSQEGIFLWNDFPFNRESRDIFISDPESFCHDKRSVLLAVRLSLFTIRASLNALQQLKPSEQTDDLIADAIRTYRNNILKNNDLRGDYYDRVDRTLKAAKGLTFAINHDIYLSGPRHNMAFENRQRERVSLFEYTRQELKHFGLI